MTFYSPHDLSYAPNSEAEKVNTPPPVFQVESSGSSEHSSDGPQTELRQTLKERHVNMIGFSTVLGVGLFLSGGKAIYMAGPGGAVLAYLLAGTIMWSAMGCVGEMTALFPVKGPVFEFPRRFIDESVGLAIGWLSWFSWCITMAAEILAITEIFKFAFKTEYLQDIKYPAQSVEWRVGMSTSPAIWVGIFLLLVLLANLLPVHIYGQMEYVFGCIKITVLVAIIVFNTTLNARHRIHQARFWTYQEPLGFSTKNFTVRSDGGSAQDIVYTGAAGGLAAFWTATTTTLFSLMGWEIIYFTAAENKDLRKSESLKLATRKITLRVILLYALAAFTVGLNVPYDDKNLADITIHGITGGQNSVFVIAAVREHVKLVPHLLNAFFVFSPCSTAINNLYAASRTLHALASHRDAWPQWPPFESIRARLETTRNGVPMNAVFTSWLIGFLAFLSINSAQAENLGRMTTVAVVCTLIIFAVNCIAYLQFYRQINAVAKGKLDDELNITPEMRSVYKRASHQYPYRSHLQWIRAAYALTGCTLLIIFQGWRTLVPPTQGKDFIASYIPIVLFLLLTLGYFVKDRGFSPRNWGFLAVKLHGLEAVGPIVVSANVLAEPCAFCGAKHRRGHLRFPDKAMFTLGNFRALMEWIWVWLK
ncbi:amino acid transporter [Pleomassaria siparia CBS 279.74]|uniref:Amino acid transporter n=1 Tax=Pleomassaria siparia CBS 279.74 TaxID=1314801 RepID=A0A6G1JRC0_9PLEO|nr:amino acid transporter [Pleomassaria siparia CBS 279.74]